jgi:hypothetical protein
MDSYKGQKFNPKEDSLITNESLFRVLDADTGKWVDVRELLGVTAEDFKNNPELYDILKQMNSAKPMEESKGDENMTQKERHFKYFEQLDTIPVDSKDPGGMELA